MKIICVITFWFFTISLQVQADEYLTAQYKEDIGTLLPLATGLIVTCNIKGKDDKSCTQARAITRVLRELSLMNPSKLIKGW